RGAAPPAGSAQGVDQALLEVGNLVGRAADGRVAHAAVDLQAVEEVGHHAGGGDVVVGEPGAEQRVADVLGRTVAPGRVEEVVGRPVAAGRPVGEDEPVGGHVVAPPGEDAGHAEGV